jgi:hypothetical protein
MSLFKKNIFLILGITVMASMLLVYSCRPEDLKNTSLGAKPTAAFTVTPVDGKTNTYLLASNTTNTLGYRWDIGDGSKPFNGNSMDTVYYGLKGDYKVSLVVWGKGGYDTVSKIINVANDDPNGCFGFKQLLTNCDSVVGKTWMLDPHAGALWVGPADYSQTWWASGASDVTARSCQFNDEYTFKKNGEFVYNTKGDFWVDNDNGNDPWPTDMQGPSGCYSTATLPSKYSAWGDGTHNFKIIGNKLQVSGTGAFMALYKAGENGTTGQPESVITYDIVSLTSAKLVIKKVYSWGMWQFTFIAK